VSSFALFFTSGILANVGAMMAWWNRALVITAVMLVDHAAVAASEPSTRIGVVVNIEGNVYVARTGLTRPVPLVAEQPVYAEDAIETQARSRVQLLLDHDTLITLAEDTRLVLGDARSAEERQARLLGAVDRGHVRLLIGRDAYGDARSQRLQLPESDIVLSHGYLTAWVAERIPAPPDGHGVTEPSGARAVGVANIGMAGDVMFSSAKEKVVVPPGHFSTAVFQGPPHVPALIGQQRVVRQTLLATEMKPVVRRETPKALLQTLTVGTGLNDDRRPTSANARPDSATAMFTPPAVISGAALTAASAAPGTSIGGQATPAATSSHPVTPVSGVTTTPPAPAASPAPSPVIAPTPASSSSPSVSQLNVGNVLNDVLNKAKGHK